MPAAIEVMGETVVATSSVPGAPEASDVVALAEQDASVAMPKDAEATAVRTRLR